MDFQMLLVARLEDRLIRESAQWALVLTRFDGQLKTGILGPDGVRLNGQALQAQVQQRVQG
jgi:hypothetical protein